MGFHSALSIALPELVLAGGAVALLLAGAFSGKSAMPIVSWGSIALLLVVSVITGATPDGVAFGGAVVSDAATRFADVAIYLASAVAVYLGQGWLTRVGNAKFEYPVLIVLSALGMGMMVGAGDLLSLYIGIELQSLALYVMCAFQRDDAKASEAGLKYFVLGALSSGLLLYGASLVYGFAGSTHFADIAKAAQGGSSVGIVFGLVFLICGLAFKVSAAPFHMWTPDVYEGAPIPVTAFIAAAPKLAAMVLFARLLAQGFPHAVPQWSQVVTVVALISVTVGAFGGLVQKNLKRLLAYSSIANIGYALLGLASGSTMGIQGMLMFMVLYMIDVTGFFACIMALSRGGKPMDTLPSMAGLVRVRPGLAVAITILSLSVLGLPPLSGFWAKFYVFKAAVSTKGLEGAAVYGLVASVVAAFYYLRIIKTMWFDAPEGDMDAAPVDARVIAFGAAAFSFVLVNLALSTLDPLALLAAKVFGLA